jgi:uncharacterized protein
MNKTLNTIYKSKEELALSSISYFVTFGKKLEVDKTQIAKDLQISCACFVTLYIDGKLRGCIGEYKATRPLYQSIIDNAVSAANFDYRFSKINREELSKITVEVSVLSPLSEFKPKNTVELLENLNRDKPGVMLEKNGKKAIFLPQVWEQLPDAYEFLTQLSLKASLSPDDWKSKDMKFWIFNIV